MAYPPSIMRIIIPEIIANKNSTKERYKPLFTRILRTLKPIEIGA